MGHHFITVCVFLHEKLSRRLTVGHASLFSSNIYGAFIRHRCTKKQNIESLQKEPRLFPPALHPWRREGGRLVTLGKTPGRGCPVVQKPMLLLFHLILNSPGPAKCVCFPENAPTISQRCWGHLNEISRRSVLNNPGFGSVHTHAF